MYTVAYSGNNIINIIDLTKNSIVNRVKVPGQVINGPIVVSDRCSVVYKTGNQNKGIVIKLPSGAIVDRFTA